jgi:hypothetical protein
LWFSVSVWNRVQLRQSQLPAYTTMLRSTVLLFSALCLDFAYESSVHAFLPVPGVLRASLGRQNIPALSLHTSQVCARLRA